jgi:D-sedoheptulose 7-phosphate isomerase
MNTKDTIRKILEESIAAKQKFLGDESGIAAVIEAVDVIIGSLKKGGKVIVFGNGGSAADSQHLAAELVVRFEKERKALPAVALTTDTSILTATANDYDFSKVFSRQVEALAGPSDVVFAISTSGNSPNVIEGARAARAKNVPVIALTGRDGGKLAAGSDVSIIVRSDNTARVQEVHQTLIHVICKLVEDAFA